MMVIANLIYRSWSVRSINYPYPDKWCGLTLNVIKRLVQTKQIFLV